MVTNWVYKLWGAERIIVNNESYCGKKMTLLKDHYSSFHYHNDGNVEKAKTETFYVTQGKVLVIFSYSDSLIKDEKEKVHIVLGYGQEVILQDMREVDTNLKKKILVPGDTFNVPADMRHMFYGLEDSEFFEFSTHDYGTNIRLTESH